MKTVEEVLQNCTIEDLLVKLPEIQFERKFYKQIAQRLEGIGGKWNRKLGGFLFKQNPNLLLNRVAEGEKVNLKKEFQFFPTPDAIADNLVQLANIQEFDEILEPHGGDGAIIKAIRRAGFEQTIDTYELMELNQQTLKTLSRVNFLGNDFLLAGNKRYQKIIANPPFHNFQDVQHIYKMYSRLVPKGRLVSISSPSWKDSQIQKAIDFRRWLEFVKFQIIELSPGSFKESGTNVGGFILVIDKA